MSKEGEGCNPISMNKKQISPSWLIDSNESEQKSPPSKQRKSTYKEKRDFLMSNKQVKNIFIRQRASPEGETKEQRLGHLGCKYT